MVRKSRRRREAGRRTLIIEGRREAGRRTLVIGRRRRQVDRRTLVSGAGWETWVNGGRREVRRGELGRWRKRETERLIVVRGWC